jgi:sulfopyruvate decarboxylase subunit alpha
LKREAVEAVVSGLKEAGINFISMLPDSDFVEAQRAVMDDKSFSCVPVSNEAIGIGVCAGAWLGGKKPALLITTDAILAGAFSLAVLNMQKNIPVVMVVPYRGAFGDGVWFMNAFNLTTEPILRDLHVSYTTVTAVDHIVPAIKQAAVSAEAWLRPTAVLLAGGIIFEEA